MTVRSRAAAFFFSRRTVCGRYLSSPRGGKIRSRSRGDETRTPEALIYVAEETTSVSMYTVGLSSPCLHAYALRVVDVLVVYTRNNVTLYFWECRVFQSTQVKNRILGRGIAVHGVGLTPLSLMYCMLSHLVQPSHLCHDGPRWLPIGTVCIALHFKISLMHVSRRFNV